MLAKDDVVGLFKLTMLAKDDVVGLFKLVMQVS
jgi:hypothetical protein